MKVLGIRFCSVSSEAEPLADFLDGLGMPRKDLGECGTDSDAFTGATSQPKIAGVSCGQTYILT